MKHTTALEAKVVARNKVHEHVLKYVPVLVDILTPFVGEKVQNATGCLSKRVSDEIKGNMPTDQNIVHYWIECTRYSIRVHFRVCESHPSRNFPDTNIATYAEASFSVGELARDSGILNELNTIRPEYWRTDYTVDEIKRLRIEADVLDKHLQDVDSKLSGFGYHDNN